MEGQTLKYPAIRNYVAGHSVDNAFTATMDVFSPLNGQLISTLPLSNAAALDAAVQAAKAAYPVWAATPIKERVQIFTATKRCWSAI